MYNYKPQYGEKIGKIQTGNQCKNQQHQHCHTNQKPDHERKGLPFDFPNPALIQFLETLAKPP